ncbi:hypothetical protein [Streptomyces iconiensis]|uniref:Secreted protein n=1 Tax=Streptomyces iconiensis TaxID=1384038 RepID=A0ABT6ZYT1_9ACTN|nr:hypothetical protein [Streptomyces iconiensis]MDJ1134227.1 hypothetical protein [Streptomyces iconiensis]
MRHLTRALATAAVTAFMGGVLVVPAAASSPAAPPAPTGCTTWTENDYESGIWVGAGQCDTGKYVVEVRCRNILTGTIYFSTGSRTFPTKAPRIAYTPCDRDSVAQEAWIVPVS